MSILSNRARTTLSFVSGIYVIGIAISSSTIRATSRHLFAPSKHPIRLLALLIAILLNAKSLPLVWHVRIFWPMYYQLFLQPTPLPRDALFRPILTSGCRTPLSETDYNAHKSNSTYFADFDVGRSGLVTCLLRRYLRTNVHRASNIVEETSIVRKAMANLAEVAEVAEAGMTLRTPQAPSSSPPPTKNRSGIKPTDKLLVALGGVSCAFKRELAPSEQFDIWTRVLSWDRKWIYLVSHMVRAGTVRPAGYVLQPWKMDEPSIFGRIFGSGKKGAKSHGGPSRERSVLKDLETEKTEEWSHAVFASSISKYVVKKGRVTIPPEIVLQRSGLLPERPGSSDTPDVSTDAYAWTWDNVEKERLRGWELARHFAALDGAVDELGVSWPPTNERLLVLGDYQDLANF